MAVIKTIKKGESLSFGFAFPDTYDITRLQNVKVYIGSSVYTHSMDGQKIRVVLQSNDTKLLTGTNVINLLVDDSVFGIRKVDYGSLQILPTQAVFSDQSVNLGYDFLIPLIVTENTISVENVLYSVIEGKAATIAVGTVTTLAAGEDATVENVGDENEAVFNFGIPQGIQGERGYTPYIGENGNWFINGVDTGVQAEGDATQQWVSDNYVEKESGKSLIADTEIARLATVTNQTLGGLGGEAAANKQDSLAVDGTGTKFPTVDAVNAMIVGELGDSETQVMSQKAVTDELGAKANHGYESNPKTLKEVDDSKIDKLDIEQVRSQATNKVASSKLLDDELSALENADDAIVTSLFKTLNIGTGGLVTMKPTMSYFTYRLNVLSNLTLNIDLSKMIQQVGNARCRLIIDMPIVKTITITKPLLWGGTAPTFTAAGQYIFEIIDVDGTGTPLIWQVASTTKVEPTGVILYVDSDGADYTVGQINGETATRTTSTWAAPFKYLQNAINAAQAGDIIFVKQGVYKPTHLRTTPTVYVDGDRLDRNATFTPKNGVDIYGGFVGTETKTWQRVMDANGYPVNKTILCGDIAGEATVDPAKTVGDTRTDASKANAAYNVVFGKAISALTYLNGVNVRYGNASEETGDQSSGGGIYSATLFVGINCTSYNNTATRGGGWWGGTNTNCTAYSNTATYGGGWRDGTNTNCTAYSNTATNGGGWYQGTNTNCTAYSNTATNGGGWSYGTNTNCTAYSNTAATNGGGWYLGTNTNCTAYSNTATNGGGWSYGTNTNCTAYSNTATNGGGWSYGTNTNCTAYSNTATYVGGWSYGTNTNCTGVNNKAPQAVTGSSTSDTHINCLLYNNKTAAGVATGFDDNTTSGVKIFRNNAYDVAHPTITGGAGSDINTSTCIQNLTLEQAKIDVPTFIGEATTSEQLAELHAYAATITTKLKPKAGSVLKGAGVNNTTYPNPTDYEGTERPEASTIGILEGE